jgi:hypothetical protein
MNERQLQLSDDPVAGDRYADELHAMAERHRARVADTPAAAHLPIPHDDGGPLTSDGGSPALFNPEVGWTTTTDPQGW